MPEGRPIKGTHLHKVLLALVERPCSSQAAAILAGVGVAQHYLLMVAMHIPALRQLPSSRFALMTKHCKGEDRYSQVSLWG